MSEKKFLDLTGLDYFWTKVKNYITGQLSGKADKVSNPTDGRLLKMNGYGNLADSGKSVSDFVLGTDKGANNGVASLDSSGKIPTSQLPSDIHDIVEGNSSSNFPGTGTTGRLYVAKDTNKIYRWDGSTYVEVALKLGTTNTTAFAGDKGKAIEDKIPSSASASNKLATSSDVSNKLNAPSQAGTNGQVLTSDGQGGQSWQDPQGGGVSDYDDLLNKPSINNQELNGNKTSAQLGLQDQLVSGTTIKKFNNQSILGSGNIDTVNGYINANSVSDLNTNYPAASEFSSKIALVPSQTTEGSLDYYVCVEGNNNTWSWTLAGTTSPIVSTQEVDTYQPLIPIKTVEGYYVGKSTGTFSTGNLNTIIFDIEGVNEIVCDFSLMGAGTGVLAFFTNAFNPDDFTNIPSGAWLGWRLDKWKYGYDNTTLPSGTNINMYNQLVGINSDTTMGVGDITGAKYACLAVLKTNTLGVCRSITPVPQSLIKKTATPNVITEFVTIIQKPFVTTMSVAPNPDSEITTISTLSPWAVIFPTSYANIGRPTPVVAMLHGLGGIVTSQVMGYSGTGWVSTRQAYLDAGFAVMDVNGYGVSQESDDNSKHWGNPLSIETLDKAFEYLKQNYNVCEKLLIAGISMGSILAMGYAKCFPGKVAAVGCFAPNLFAYSMRYISGDGSKERAWQYQNHDAADTDNYKNLTGYVVLNECQVIDTNGVMKKYEWPSTKPADWPANLADVQLVDSFPVPMRVWQGTSDDQVNPNCSKLLVSALRRGNSTVSLRLCLNVGHDVQNEQYVREEAVDWFKRYRGESSGSDGGSYVDTGLPTGGTTGQVLVKKSNNSYDTEWVDLNNGYITADSTANRPTASEEYKSKICLVPASDNSGAMDQYVCVLNGSTWEWQLGGTTSPIVSVQQVDVTQNLPTSNIYSGKCISGNGLTDLSNSTVYEYDVEGLDIIYVTGRSWTSTSATSYRNFIVYLDANGDLISVDASMNYRFNNTPTILTNEAIQLPEGTKLIRLNLSSSYLTNPTPACGGKVRVPQSLVKSTVTTNTIIYGTVTIDVDSPSSVSSNTEITRTTRQSAFGIMFPLTYSNTGRPTPVIAMLHGSSGCVTPAYLGYGSGFPNWPVWRQQYLDAGFAVMDINGYGVSTENDTFSQPSGNPQSVETLDKAWEYIKLKYNVCDKLLLHGTSMGGANAMSYLMNHPEKVEAAALFAPEVVQHVVKLGGLSDSFKNSVAQAWGYTDSADAIADGFSKLIGYSPFMEDDFDWVNMDSTDFSTLTAKTRLANIPIRIWHGTDDQNIPIISSQMLVSCLKRANVPVTLRTCNGGAHNISGGAAEYVRNEAVNWFKRFVN